MRAALRRSVATALLAVGFVSGCGGDEAKFTGRTVPARGVVMFRGKPLSGGSLRTEPDNGREAHAEIGPDGSFTLGTFQPGDGAAVGVHRLAVKGSINNGKTALPARFGSIGSSDLEIEIIEGKEQYNIELN